MPVVVEAYKGSDPLCCERRKWKEIEKRKANASKKLLRKDVMNERSMESRNGNFKGAANNGMIMMEYD